MSTVYENIKAIRLEKGLTQENVAEELDLSPSNYGRVERGLTELSIDRLEKIASFFEMSVCAVLSYDMDDDLDYTADVEYLNSICMKQDKKINKLEQEILELKEASFSDYSSLRKEIKRHKDKQKNLFNEIKLLEEKLDEKDKIITDKNKMIEILDRAIALVGKSNETDS